jgi:hypothetical protein
VCKLNQREFRERYKKERKAVASSRNRKELEGNFFEN